MASKGKKQHQNKRRTRPPKQKPKPEVKPLDPQLMVRERFLLQGIIKLRELIGEERVTALVRSDVDVREQEWLKLLKEADPEIIDAAATVLTGLGLDPDEIQAELKEDGSDGINLPEGYETD